MSSPSMSSPDMVKPFDVREVAEARFRRIVEDEDLRVARQALKHDDGRL